MKIKTKISYTGLISIAIFLGGIFYLSYNFYKSSSFKDSGPVTKISANDKLSIDSIKNDAYQKYKGQIDQLKSDLSLKDTIINQRNLTLSKLKNNYDSVINKLDYYKHRLREAATPDSIK